MGESKTKRGVLLQIFFGIFSLLSLVSCGGNEVTTSPFSKFAALSAEFSASPTTGNAPLTVVFSDQSTGGSVILWFWDFGDGGTSTEQNPSHDYAIGGTYTVSLTVTGPSGSDTITKVDHITVASSVFTDDFNRANADPIGGNWVNVVSLNNMKIVSNQLLASAIPAAVYYNQSVSANQYSRAKIAGGGGAGDVSAFLARVGTVDRTYYYLTVYPTSGYGAGVGLDIGRRNAGANTLFTSGTTTVNIGDTIEIRTTGTGTIVTIKGYVNGAEVISYDDSGADRILSGYPGLYTNTAAITFDDWEGGSLQ